MPERYFENLLQTKIYTPPLRADYVSRPRLVEQLKDADPDQSIIVKSPAGYGKTTLVVEWLNSVDAGHAWFSIDQRDNDLAQFLSYIAFSLNQVESGICTDVLDQIHSPEPPPPKRMLDEFINDLACLEERTILVLDDYHLISNEEIHHAVSYLLQYHPPQIQIVILSREDLPFPTSTLKAHNRLVELDFFDLRFTIREADSFLKKAFDIDLPFEEVARLDNRVEGWVTGLQLAGLSLRNRPDKEKLLSQFSGKDHLIQSFLFEEVLSYQPRHIQRFLLRTSILNRLSAPLCNYLLEIDNSQAILEELEESNLFIIPLDNKREKYRYHHLFADALQDQLEKSRPSLVPALHQRAIDWYRGQGDMEEAIEYAIRAEDFDQASEMISSIVNRVIREGGRRRILRWLSSFPRAVLREHFMLWAHLITAHLGLGEFARARESLASLWGDEAYLQNNSDHEKRLIRANNAGFLASIEIHTTMDAVKVKELARKAMEEFPEEVEFGRSVGPGYYAVGCFHRGEIEEAKRYIEQAIQLSRKHQYSRLELLWMCYRAQIELAGGDLTRTQEYLDEAYRFADGMGVQKSNVVSNVILSQGGLYYELNDLDKAEGVLQEGLLIAGSASFLDHMMWGFQFYLPFLTANAKFEQARQELSKARDIAAQFDRPPLVHEHLDALAACVNLQAGMLEEARIWAADNHSWQEEEKLGAMEFKWLTLSKVWMAARELQKCIPLLQALVQESRQLQRGKGFVASSVLLSRAYLLDQQPSAARGALLPALEFAQPHGYIRTVLDGGREVWELLQKMSVEKDQPYRQSSSLKDRYIKQLLISFEEEVKRMEELGLDFGCSPRGELLTRREGEILALLAEGLSYAEIADALTITENTVKSHIKNMYRKLRVNNRTEAVNQARSMNIL